MAASPGYNWQRIEELFYAALEQAPSERNSFLDRACGGDVDLRREIDSLLSASDKTLGFIQKPVQEAARNLDGDSIASGRQIGVYRLLRVLGEGGMGRVYLAARADDLYEQQVAIKLMHAGFAQTQRMLLRFGAERQILANLNHPNIARLLDGGVSDGLPYLVMEYVDGVPIDQYCRERRLMTEERLRLFCTVCRAVEYAHKNLVVHRDIKPGNILVSSTGIPKLLDFGIAKLLASDGVEMSRTRTAERMMTPEYASPEQVRGDNITTSTDVYALGVLLYELLSGRRPFHLETTSPIEVVRAICEQTPTAPSVVGELNPELAPPDASRKLRGDLDNIVLMAMRKEPARRYVSAGQFAEDVEAFLGGYPVRARTDAWGYRSGKFIRRHRAAVVATVVVAIALVGFSIGMGLLARRAQRKRTAAEREAQFLNSIFQSTTPEQTRGKQVTGRELLDQGAKRVETEFSGEPQLQATLFDNIGRAYMGIGQYQTGETLLQRAYDLRKQILGRDNLDTAATLDALATAIRLHSDYARAEPYFREALAVRQRKLHPDDPLIGRSLSNLGECLYWEGKNPEAESLLRQALQMQRNRGLDEDIATSDNYLALVLQRKGDFHEASLLLRDAVAINAKISGTDSPDYANSLHNLAGTLIDSGDLTNAETMDRQALAIRRKIDGPHHPDVGYPLNNLGFVFLEKGDWAAAQPFLKENLDIQTELNPKSARLAGALNNWGRMLEEKGDYKGADNSFGQALAMMHETNSPESWNVAKVLANLGLLRADEGKYSAAEELEKQALDMRKKLGGDESPDLATSYINLALVQSWETQLGSAESLLRQALAIRKKEMSAGHPAIISAEIRLGEILTDEGKAGEAEPLLRQALAEVHAVPFPLTQWQVAEVEIGLGAALAEEGHTAEAQKLLENPEVRLRGYPLAALRRSILLRAQKAQKKLSS